MGWMDDERRAMEERVPAHTLAGLIDYRDNRTPQGGFLTAVLENDLAGACGRADLSNADALLDIVRYVWNFMPAASWGSPEVVKAWLKREVTDG